MTISSNIRTFQDLFKYHCNIQIPVYQRAYSWGREQCRQFFDDLIEQNGKQYHFGLFIFEKDTDGTYFIIDGQQRLTTAVLFLSALSKLQAVNIQNGEKIREMYLSGSFSTVADDNAYFNQLIKYYSCGDMKAETLSQIKIKKAFDFFSEELEKYSKKNGLEKVTHLLQSLEKAKIGIFVIDDKGEASQVFEYQNNRGIRASAFEIIKAYLVHQIYIKSADYQADIENIQNSISRIYRNFESISDHFSEDDILWCWFYLYEYDQDLEYNIDGIKWCLSPENKKKPIKDTDICHWVNVFFNNFVKITDAAKNLISKYSAQIENLFLIGTTPYWPVVVLAVILKETTMNNERLNQLAKLLEILWFKYEISNRRKDSLPEWAYYYFNNDKSEEKITFDDLCKKIKEAIDSGFNGFWPEFKRIIPEYLGENDHFSKFKNATRYVLWQYENILRKDEGLPLLSSKKYRTYNTIEHIQSQNTGFNYIHKLGNLTLLTKSDNSRASDDDFADKKQKVYLKYYDKEKSDKVRLLQYRDILSKNDWREQEVNERLAKIKDFVNTYFKVNG